MTRQGFGKGGEVLGLKLGKKSSFHSFLEIFFRILFPATLSTGGPEINSFTVVLDGLGLGVDDTIWVNRAKTLLLSLIHI